MKGSRADREVVVLAGGLGTRLRAELPDTPKVLAEVHGRPFLEWLLRYLRTLGFGRCVLCTGHLAGIVEKRLGGGSGTDIEILYSREDSPLGTGGAVRRAMGLVRSRPFFAVNGDSFCPFEPERMFKAHGTGARATLWLTEALSGARYGSVTLSGNGTVTSFREKAAGVPGGLVSAGIYLMEESVFEGFEAATPLSLEREVFPSLPAGAMRGVTGAGPLLDIGTPESLAAASALIEGSLFPLLAEDRGPE